MYNKDFIASIVKEYGSTFYLVDLDIFESNYISLKNAFLCKWPKFNIAYSFKTNYMPSICSKVKGLNGFAEVVSEMELKIARKVGFSFNKIIWNGPIKDEGYLLNFILNGGLVNIDNSKELNFIVSACKKYPDFHFNIGIRLNFPVGDGVISRFGFDCCDSSFSSIIETIYSIKNLSICSLQCHFAKRDVKYWPNRVSGLLEVFLKYKKALGNLKYIDLGGGIYGGMPNTLASQLKIEPASYEDYALAIAKPLLSCFEKEAIKPTLLIEPGTALVSDCVFFFCKVDNFKRIQNKWFASTTGSQKNISMNNINPPIYVYDYSKNRRFFERLDMVGYTCIENDVLFKGYEGYLGEDDIVSFGNCGSYSIVMKPPFILPNCPVLCIHKGTVFLQKRRERFSDLFLTYYFNEDSENAKN